MTARRPEPNILITGTPGTGKTTLADQVAQVTGLKRIDVGEIAKQQNLYDGFDENYDCHNLDEEKLMDEIEDQVDAGGVIVDYHGSEFFPKRWFDAVFVLRTDNSVLYERLEHRGYNAKKIRENVECEIFGTLVEEAKDSYDESIVFELQSDTAEEMEANVDRLVTFVNQWRTGPNTSGDTMMTVN